MSRPDVLDAKTSRILPPAAGADCPRVDLLQAQSAISERCAHLDAQLPSLMAGLQRTLGGLFNGLECRLELSPFELCDGAASFTRGLPQETDTASLLWGVYQAPVLPAGGLGCGLMQIAADELFRLAELFFGGLPSPRPQPARAPSDTEWRLLQRLLAEQLNALGARLGLVLPWEVPLLSPNQPPARGCWARSRLQLRLGSHLFHWRFYWPLPADDAAAEAADLAVELEQALRAVPVRVIVQMQEWQMNLAEVSQLQVGDILPLDMQDPMPAGLGGLPCFKGHVAEHQGYLVFQVVA
ncbi:FliM/FliN family flagellar motor switch protein [Pseudaeromonas sp. ZJS20]|uniref:FliM/FliN family flagellar motor switch protein n=1 Tax=Pseudaeromonas aegiceratis TaxID=3153928 RepID=UPI00390C6B02